MFSILVLKYMYFNKDGGLPKSMINLTEKLKIAMIKQSINQLELANRTQQSKSNLSQKFSLNNFKLSEYSRLVEALGCTLEINIVLPNGEKI